MNKLNKPVAASDFIPHRGSMKLIDSLLECGKNICITEMLVKKENIFLFENNMLDPVIYMELMAQTAACHSRFLNPDNIKDGFLVGVTDFVLLENVKIYPDNSVRTIINKENEFSGFGIFSGEIIFNNTLIAKSNIRVWEKDADSPLPKGECNSGEIKIQTTVLLKDEILNNLVFLEKVILKKEKQRIKAEFILNKNFIGFDGHFFQNPILPGVIMVKIGQSILEKAIGLSLIINSAPRIKFIKVIKNDEKISVILDYKVEENIFLVDIKLFRTEEVCSSIYCSFRERK